MKLYKLSVLIIVLFLNIGCESYYSNDKNPFKSSGKCANDKYSYNKLDLASEDFGIIGVASNKDEYPRAGIDNVFTSNNDRYLNIRGSFNSLCESSFIDKVKMELYNGKGGKKTYYPNSINGYSGSFSIKINTNEHKNDRCFYKKAQIHLKTWARDEDGNTYFAHNYTDTPNINVKSDIRWNHSYKYDFVYRYKNIEINSSIIYEYEEKTEIKEENDGNYTYRYRYQYKYRYTYEHGDQYKNEYPISMTIYADNNYEGAYFQMNVDILGYSSKAYPISNDDRKTTLNIKSNSILQKAKPYTIKVSFMEKVNMCNIESTIITKKITMPKEKLLLIQKSFLMKTRKTLLSSNRTFIDKVEIISHD